MGPHQGRNGRQGVVYVDTQAALWIRRGKDWLSKRAVEIIERGDLMVSPMVLFELQVIREIGRIQDSRDELMDYLRTSMGAVVCDLPWETVVRAAAAEQWTRDPFDRLIVANARARQSPLLTADRAILRNYADAFC